MKCQYRGDEIYKIEIQYAKDEKEKEKIKELINVLKLSVSRRNRL